MKQINLPLSRKLNKIVNSYPNNIVSIDGWNCDISVNDFDMDNRFMEIIGYEIWEQLRSEGEQINY